MTNDEIPNDERMTKVRMTNVVSTSKYFGEDQPPDDRIDWDLLRKTDDGLAELRRPLFEIARSLMAGVTHFFIRILLFFRQSSLSIRHFTGVPL